MSERSKKPSYRVKVGGDTFSNIAKNLFGDDTIADKLAAYNQMTPDTELAEGYEVRLPNRLFFQKGAFEKSDNKSIMHVAVCTPKLCWVSFEEAWPTKEDESTGPLEDKWVYIVADDDIAVTVDAKSDGGWVVDNRLFRETQQVNDGWIQLRPEKEYRFFISPIQLSGSAEDLLVEKIDELQIPLLRPKPMAQDVITLRDPFAWTVDLHTLRYQPGLEALNEWRYDERRMSKLFIASTLKQLIGNKDDLSIEDQLQEEQPDHWLKEYDKDDTKLRKLPEQAMADIATWVESWEHRIIEQAAIDNGGNDLQLAVLQWASFMYGASETLPGRNLISYATKNENRIPRKYILTETSTDLDLSFKEHRFLANAGMGLLKDLAPGIADLLRSRSNKWEVLRLWFERYEETKVTKGSYKKIKRALDQGRRITKKIFKQRDKLNKLINEADKSRKLLVKVPKKLARAERLTEAFNRNFGATTRTLSYGLEVINIAMAISDLTSGSGGSIVLKAISATGAATDLGVVIVESFGTLVEEGAKTGLKKAALILGCISGVCDCIDFLASASESSGKHDYNAMVGHGIAAVGAAGMAVGCGIALAELAAGGAVVAGATGVGLIVLLIGAGLIATGSVLAAWLTDNAYEQFAEHSFLGDSAGNEEQIQFSWAPADYLLPNPDPIIEMRTLIALLSNFRTSAFSRDLSGGSVIINPGYYRDGDVFELFMHHDHGNNKLGPLKCQVIVDMKSGDIRQIAGNRPLADNSEIEYDDTSRIKEIKISIEEGIPRPDLWLGFKSRTMWMRLKSKDGFTVPPRDNLGNDTWHRSTYNIDSAINSGIRGSSLDKDHRATPNNNPPPKDLEPIK